MSNNVIITYCLLLALIINKILYILFIKNFIEFQKRLSLSQDEKNNLSSSQNRPKFTIN